MQVVDLMARPLRRSTILSFNQPRYLQRALHLLRTQIDGCVEMVRFGERCYGKAVNHFPDAVRNQAALLRAQRAS
jgi:hypothetical protein